MNQTLCSALPQELLRFSGVQSKIEHSAYFQDFADCLLRRLWSKGMLGTVPQEDIPLLTQLFPYHDIGKIALPTSLLHKQGRLTADELSQLQTHPVLGEALAEALLKEHQDSPLYPYLRELCRHHHERWDGSGYPDGLRGSEIQPYVQAIGMVDAFDALLTRRSYRPALSPTEAASMIVSGACGAFAPDFLSVFRSCIPQLCDIVQAAAS